MATFFNSNGIAGGFGPFNGGPAGVVARSGLHVGVLRQLLHLLGRRQAQGHPRRGQGRPGNGVLQEAYGSVPEGLRDLGPQRAHRSLLRRSEGRLHPVPLAFVYRELRGSGQVPRSRQDRLYSPTRRPGQARSHPRRLGRRRPPSPPRTSRPRPSSSTGGPPRPSPRRSSRATPSPRGPTSSRIPSTPRRCPGWPPSPKA